MNFSIEQIIGLSKQGFTADQIKAFDGAMTPAQVPMVQPQAQPQVQPVYQPQVQPTQPVYQPQPMPEGNGNDTSMALLNIIQNMQKNNLSQASGAGTKPETALDVGLDILGMNKGGNK